MLCRGIPTAEMGIFSAALKPSNFFPGEAMVAT
jgi:hypothetical protein